MSLLKTVPLTLLLSASPALANGGLVDICHHGAGNDGTIIISVAPEAVAYHVRTHGDSVTGHYWTDADGDGFGDPGGSYTMCPGDGRVDNAHDCADTDASVHPLAAEVCGDGIDNNCDGLVDEECVSCPCFSYEDIEYAHQEFLLDAPDYDQAYPTCSIVESSSTTVRDSTALYFQKTSNDGEWFVNDSAQFWTAGWEDDGQQYCSFKLEHYGRHLETGERDFYYYEPPVWRPNISYEERLKCQEIAESWSAYNDLMCRTFTY